MYVEELYKVQNNESDSQYSLREYYVPRIFYVLPNLILTVIW